MANSQWRTARDAYASGAPVPASRRNTKTVWPMTNRRWRRDHSSNFDPVPEEVIERARAAYEQRRSTGPLAAVVSDVADEHGERHLSFTDGHVHVELVVTAAGRRWDLRGRVEPPELHVELELEASDVSVGEATTGGRFAFDAVPGGLMRLRLLAGGDAEPMTTDWFYT